MPPTARPESKCVYVCKPGANENLFHATLVSEYVCRELENLVFELLDARGLVCTHIIAPLMKLGKLNRFLMLPMSPYRATYESYDKHDIKVVSGPPKRYGMKMVKKWYGQFQRGLPKDGGRGLEIVKKWSELFYHLKTISTIFGDTPLELPIPFFTICIPYLLGVPKPFLYNFICGGCGDSRKGTRGRMTPLTSSIQPQSQKNRNICV